ncbi:MAG: 23S rRNA (adenine(2503)-C(2))-methyltransferase RlmN [Clostridia bacterium]|nr:23S rRNA (adenine(2503)-C(2))-methyltransferase RlmN [Clostridia bacterium]
MPKTDISSLFPNELEDFLRELSEKEGVKIEKFRASQIFSWLTKGVSDFSEMKNVPASLREVLERNAYIALPKIKTKLVSKIDGTVKYLFELYDGECIESVFMRYEHGNTVCISSQVGCRMGCTFCASTLGGLKRNLTPSEMTGQIIAAQNDTGEKISNVVMMGIGEPLDNFENTIKFLELVNLKEGLNIGMRHISLSTCGICEKIKELADMGTQITLSVSLHAPDGEKRKKLMPIAKKYSLDELMDACRYYTEKTKRRISFEYSMIKGENDTRECAEKLKNLLSGMLCHVNLIPLNRVKERAYEKSERQTIEEFSSVLERAHITVTVRRKLGSDINASCGQLRREHTKDIKA